MFLKIVIFLIAMCNIVLDSEAAVTRKEARWIPEIIEKYKPEIAEIKGSIEMLELRTVFSEEMASSCKLRLKLIAKESNSLLKSLNNIVQNTTAEAANEKVNINTCTEEEKNIQDYLQEHINQDIQGIHDKYSGEFERYSEAIENLKNMLPPLTEYVDKLLKSCLVHNFLPWQSEKLTECIVRGMDDTKTQISRIGTGLDELDRYMEEQFDHMENDISELMQVIVQGIINIVERLKECIASISNEKPTTEIPNAP